MSDLMVEVMRNGFMESRHYGDVAVVDSSGRLLYSVGDATRKTFARSAAKPLQAIPFVESGAVEAFRLTPRHIAIACGSHEGEPIHTSVVEDFLSRMGLNETHLQCGIHPPYQAEARDNLIRAGRQPSALHNNCSGKHAGMLASAVHLKETTDGYLAPEHPVQQRIRAVISEMTSVPLDELDAGVDGCGVPVFAMPLRAIALAYARLSAPDKLSEERAKAVRIIVSAMNQFPELVGGTNRFCTALMSAGQGQYIGKLGAEGVYCIGILSCGLGICLKVDDGDDRAVAPAVLEVLMQLNLIPQATMSRLQSFHHPTILNRAGVQVGHLNPVLRLKKH